MTCYTLLARNNAYNRMELSMKQRRGFEKDQPQSGRRRLPIFSTRYDTSPCSGHLFLQQLDILFLPEHRTFIVLLAGTYLVTDEHTGVVAVAANNWVPYQDLMRHSFTVSINKVHEWPHGCAAVCNKRDLICNAIEPHLQRKAMYKTLYDTYAKGSWDTMKALFAPIYELISTFDREALPAWLEHQVSNDVLLAFSCGACVHKEHAIVYGFVLETKASASAETKASASAEALWDMYIVKASINSDDEQQPRLHKFPVFAFFDRCASSSPTEWPREWFFKPSDKLSAAVAESLHRYRDSHAYDVFNERLRAIPGRNVVGVPKELLEYSDCCPKGDDTIERIQLDFWSKINSYIERFRSEIHQALSIMPSPLPRPVIAIVQGYFS